jgi:hypothetical protein
MTANGYHADAGHGHLTAKAKAKIEASQANAARDFRSDVVTVPTESMMEVSSLRRSFLAVHADRSDNS